MLKIRQQQLDALAHMRREQALREKALLFKKTYPSVFQYYTPEQVNTWLNRQVERLQTYGIDTIEAEDHFLHLFALYGENFERCDNATELRALLASTNLSVEEKNDRVVHMLKHKNAVN